MSSRFETTFNARVVPASERAFGVSVTFSRGNVTSEPFMARRSDLKRAVMGQGFGLGVSSLVRGFLLPVASVVLDGDTIEPRKGDKIIEGDDVYQILPPDETTPAVELQSGGFEWLVYIKLVE